MSIIYQQTTDIELHNKVRRRHSSAIHELIHNGFQEAWFFGETMGALGFSPLGLSGFLGALIALFMEISRIEADFSISIFNLVVVSKETATYASPFGMGVKYYTSFTDGTCLITANFDTPAINDQVGKLYKFSLPRNITAAYQDHKKLVDELCSQGKQKIEHLSFAGFIQLAHKEDEYLLEHKNQFGGE